MKIVPEACKNNIEYMSFWPLEAVVAMREYVEAVKQYHNLTIFPENAPLFGQRENLMTPMTRRDLEYIVKTLARRAGIQQWKDVHPHCLRKSFDNTIKNSGLPEEDKEFLMGHILAGQADTYFDKTKIEEFRKKYSKIRFFEAVSAEGVRKDAAKDYLRLLENLNMIPKEQIDRLYEAIDHTKDVSEINWKDIIGSSGIPIARVLQEMTIEQVKKATMPYDTGTVASDQGGTSNIPKRIRIKAGELDEYLTNGYKPIFNLQNGDIVVELG